jgi:hypothetical protein
MVDTTTDVIIVSSGYFIQLLVLLISAYILSKYQDDYLNLPY